VWEFADGAIALGDLAVLRDAAPAETAGTGL
jgi:hypothetical protein